MKNLVRFAVAGVLATGAAGLVHAQALPSTDSSDLWLFVSDQSAGTTFAEDLNISVNSLLPSSDFATANYPSTPTAVLQPVSGDSINLTADSALATYLSNAAKAGQTVEWGVEVAQYTGPTTASKGYKQPGGIIDLADNSTAAGAGYSGMATGNLQSWSGGLESDIIYMNGEGYTAGGTTYVLSTGSIVGAAWGYSQSGSGPGSTNEYGNGPDQANIGLGTGETLYGVTGNGGTAQVQSYILGTITLADNGTLTLGSGSSPVPLPAAVWLLGSGLLGLAGVGRRRRSA